MLQLWLQRGSELKRTLIVGPTQSYVHGLLLSKTLSDLIYHKHLPFASVCLGYHCLRPVNTLGQLTGTSSLI